MIDAVVDIANNQNTFYTGETIKGNAEVTLPSGLPLTNVFLSFNCLGEVKWVEYGGTPHYLKEFVYYDKYDYLEDEFKFTEKDVTTVPTVNGQKFTIPFSFEIPSDKNLPTSMVSDQGFIKYFIQVAVKEPEKEEYKKFLKQVVVISPMEKNLMITVGGTVEKRVLLHSGTVSMHGSIGRKGFAPGETITVHIGIDNKTNAKVVPRVSLHQVQIFQCGLRHKAVESTSPHEPVVGAEIAAHTKAEELLDITIPANESLSIKSSAISVKYFVRVDLDIPHAFDMHLNLPVVLTSQKVIEKYRNQEN